MQDRTLSYDPDEMALELVVFLMTKATDSNGNLVKAVDLSTGDVVDPRPNDDELGDYVQSIAWLGKYLGFADYLQWAIDHVKASLENFFAMVKKGHPWDVTAGDRIIGPVHVLLITQDHGIGTCVDEYFSMLFRLAVSRDGMLRTKVRRSGFSLRSLVADPMSTGNHIELLCQLYLHTGKESYLDMARRLVTPWLNDRSFASCGLYLRRSIGVSGVTATWLKDILLQHRLLRRHLKGHPSHFGRITKANTHLMFGMLSFYRATDEMKAKNIINSFFETIGNVMKHSSGLYHHALDVKRNRPFHLDILSTISVIELAADTYKAFGDSMYLGIAERAAKAMLQFRDEQGLIPQCPVLEEVDQRLARLYYLGMPVSGLRNLDPQVDFFVNLVKLYECTNDQFYLEAAINLANSVIYHFGFGRAFAEILQDGRPYPVVRTKYLGLLLKLFIAMIAVQKNLSLLDDPDLSLVCQDR